MRDVRGTERKRQSRTTEMWGAGRGWRLEILAFRRDAVARLRLNTFVRFVNAT